VLRLVVSDLDGTLLTSGGRIDPFTASTLRQIEALGVHIVLATARHYLDARRFRDAVSTRGYTISSNGARVHGPDGGLLASHSLNSGIARALMSPELAGDRLVSVFVDDACLVSRRHPAQEAYFEGSDLNSRVEDLSSHHGGGIAKLMYFGDRADLLRLQATITRRFGEQVWSTFVIDECLEIMPPRVSKAHALSDVLRRLDVAQSAVVAFGDGGNDVEMLSVAGQAFVMRRSSPRLLAALPGAPSAGDNDDAGVARTLRVLWGLPA
jgi:Cof subfamily protein (haloacid dehalogenase superfamily)